MKKQLLLLAVLVIAASCTKKTEDTPVPPKDAALSKLIGRWQITSITRNGTSLTQDCETDDILEFKSNGKVFYEFKDDCFDEDRNGSTGEYAYTLTDDGRFFRVAFYQPDEFNTPREILELTSTKLKFEYDTEILPAGKYVITYQKQN